MQGACVDDERGERFLVAAARAPPDVAGTTDALLVAHRGTAAATKAVQAAPTWYVRGSVEPACARGSYTGFSAMSSSVKPRRIIH
jgi:hypothetical protein